MSGKGVLGEVKEEDKPNDRTWEATVRSGMECLFVDFM